MIDLIFNLITPLNISIEFENNPLICGLTIIVTKNGFHLARTINKYELERMDDTYLYNFIKKMYVDFYMKNNKEWIRFRELTKVI